MAENAEPPLTPWARKFGVSSDYPWNGLKSSGLHPQYPEIGAVGYEKSSPSTLDGVAIPLPQPSDAELDKLFLDEVYQLQDLAGFTTWQAVIFNGQLGDISTGLTVDEDNWLPLFTKERWYNLGSLVSEGFSGLPDSRLAADATWSVDNPVIWDTLRPHIELANRIFRASLDHPLFDAILSLEKDTDIYRNVTASGLRGDPYLASNKIPRVRSEQDVLDKIREFSEYLVISFMQPGIPGSLGTSYGLTRNCKDPNLGGVFKGWDFSMVLLNLGLVRPLLDQNKTRAEKSQASLAFTLTLCHEVVHAIWRIHQLTCPPNQQVRDEPFYQQPGTTPEQSAWINELGMAWEAAIIGGSMHESPQAKAGDWNSGGLITALSDFPNYNMAKGYNRGLDIESHKNDSWYDHAVPEYMNHLWASKEFWETHVVKYGLSALRAPKLIRTAVRQHSGNGTPQVCQLDYAVEEYRMQLTKFQAHFAARTDFWTMLRPWFRENWAQWSNSPYSRWQLRSHAVAFLEAQRAGDEFAAQRCCRKLGAFDRWIPYDLLIRDDNWIVQAVGYLMLAVMPRRLTEKVERSLLIPGDNWTPSATAAEAAYDSGATPYEVNLTGTNDEDYDEEIIGTRNIPFTPNGYFGTRDALMQLLLYEIRARQRSFPLPAAVYGRILAIYNEIKRNIPAHATTDQWVPVEVNFTLPPWHCVQRQTSVGYVPRRQYQSYNPTAQPQGFIPGAPGPGPAAPPEDLPGAPRAAKSSRRAAASSGMTYYTIGEVGNHASTGDLWVMVGNGTQGYDIYDATDTVEEMWADEPESFVFELHCQRTLMGLKALPELQRRLESSGRRVGKLVQPMRQGEIAERDGRLGRPLWILVGTDAYNISDFPFENRHQKKLMTARPGGNPWDAILDDETIDHTRLLQDLQPYRCATVASEVPDEGPSAGEESHFTLREVASHIYPETTMYTIIGGHVYNLTEYMEYHPGGTTILRQWAGKDSTEAFERYHLDGARCLEDYDYLRVGRVVSEKSAGQLTNDEVAMGGLVYDLGQLEGSGDGGRILQGLDGFRGKDMTQALGGSSGPWPAGARRLAQRPQLITAKLSARLRDIDAGTLRANDGGAMRVAGEPGAQRPAGLRAEQQMPAWVACGGMVYDLTDAWKYGPRDLRAFIDMHKGAVAPLTGLGTQLESSFGCRVIGRLTEGRRRRGDGDGDGDDGRDRAQRLRLG